MTRPSRIFIPAAGGGDEPVILSGQGIAVLQGIVTVSGSAAVVLSGQGVTASQGTITVDAGAGWSVTDVDTDETITEGQENVVVTITGTVAATGKKVFLNQGADWVEQTVTGETAQTVTITVTYGGILSAGAATLYVRNPL